MPKHKLDELSKSEAATYKETFTEWAQPLLAGASLSAFETLVEKLEVPSDGDSFSLPAAHMVTIKSALLVNKEDFNELAEAQSIAFTYPKKLLASAQKAVTSVVGVRLAMHLASETITALGIDTTIDWDETLDPHWERVLKRGVSKLVSDMMTDAFEKEDDDDSEEDGEEEDEEEESGEEEEIENDEDSGDEEEEDHGEEEEAGEEDMAEAAEELEEIRAEAAEAAAAEA